MKSDLLELIINDISNDFPEMEYNIENEDWDSLSSVSHKMKSTLSYVGNNELSYANKEIESISRYGGDYSSLSGLMQTLLNFKDQIIDELNEALNDL